MYRTFRDNSIIINIYIIDSQNSRRKSVIRIAATYNNGMIFQHFGRTEQFKLYRAENGVIESAMIVDAEGAGHGALPTFSGHGAWMP